MLGEVINTGVDAYITADIKHNVFMEAHEAGLTLIDAGHFNSEDIIVEPLSQELGAAFPDLAVTPFHFSPIKFA